jgi:hypothetical protein
MRTGQVEPFLYLRGPYQSRCLDPLPAARRRRRPAYLYRHSQLDPMVLVYCGRGRVDTTSHHSTARSTLCAGMGIIRVRAQRNSGHSHFPAGDGPCQPARRRAHVVPRDSQTLDRCPSRGQRFVGITWMTKLHPSVVTDESILRA